MKGKFNHFMINELGLTLKDVKKYNNYIKSNVAISSAVTAYAQIEMMKYKTLFTDHIYYSDTDSIFTDIELPKEMVGNELGQMKDVLTKMKTNIIDKALFLGNKQYGLSYYNKEKSVVIESST
jgi:hypothetical protein